MGVSWGKWKFYYYEKGTSSSSWYSQTTLDEDLPTMKFCQK